MREFLTSGKAENKFNSQELKEVFDLCLSCKACSSECPSNVDVATLKAEFLYQYQEENGYNLRSKLFAHNTKINAFGSRVSYVTNAIYSSKFLGGLLKKSAGVAVERNMPPLAHVDFDAYMRKATKSTATRKKVLLYLDEFTRYMDVNVGKDAIDLLTHLGYDLQMVYAESGRTYISKGFLKQARDLAMANIERLKPYYEAQIPIVGLEPSAVLTFRDEYKRLAPQVEGVEKLAKHAFLIEEFLAQEIADGHLDSGAFTTEAKTVKIHNHCHQKSLSNQKVTFDLLNLPVNYQVSIINSGCCGMAGSFGYEKEHYEVSMQVGELKLFPAIRKCDDQVVIAANGTSCRHQIHDGTQRTAMHPVSILKNALR